MQELAECRTAVWGRDGAPSAKSLYFLTLAGFVSLLSSLKPGLICGWLFHLPFHLY